MSGPIRHPYGVVYKEQSGFKDVYGGAGGMVFVECMRIASSEIPAKRAIVFTHPIGSGSFLPLITALAMAGHDVLYVNPRYRGNDTALIMEKCIADLGAALKDAKTRFGYEEFILGGWSGGGSMSLFYQDQAENPTITHTPAGDPYDLTAMDLPPVDGIMLLAAHVSRAITLTEWIDPSITDESIPFERDPQLNIYDPANPNQPPYTDDFIATYKAAQIARNRRITDWVQAELKALKQASEPNAERAFVVHGTMASPCWTDPAQEPSDRRPNDCYLGEPKVANDGPVGLARFTTLRSWLSQWGYDTTNADGLGNASRITCPVLVINNTADLACTPSHARRLFDAVGHGRKEYHDVKGADHYYIERPDLLPKAVGLCASWIERTFDA
ncbi:alpha/beta hydrolase family protein [Parerythrobacter jejuensis]|uniref:Alpha/beta fold hydrolase n=1 Tax=Parerythrobacter jejuensis TaxID=795812 RepID=A0A845ATV4_9SPHN|nr:alpha/beta hydrolase [Parerythrobacter jejuensis]MXP32939.1 alpha/beta fold hydrolase [Parerythrobacter jejuensis]